MLTGYWPGKLMLDPETIALNLPILTGEPPEGVSLLREEWAYLCE